MNARRSTQSGFTLIEMLLVMVLLAVVLGAVFGTMNRTKGEADRVGTLVEKRQTARAGVQLLERDLRMAGSGLGGAPINISFNGAPQVLYAITPGPVSGANSSDSVLIMGAWAASTVTTAVMPISSSILKVADVTGFASGDLVVITDGVTANMMEVTSTNSSSSTLQHNPASPYNQPGGFNSSWPAGGYSTGSQVYKIELLSYRVDSTSYKRPALVRRAFRQTPSVVAYNVDQFQVWYHMQNGTDTRSPVISPGAASGIDKVRPVITLRLKDRTRPTYSDSVWAEVQPRTF